MGNTFDSFRQKKRVLMIGVDGCGKKSLQLKLDKSLHDVVLYSDNQIQKTFNFERLTISRCDYHNINIDNEHWSDSPDGIIFIVDSTDDTRLNEAHALLHRAMWYLKRSVYRTLSVLVLANKCDLSHNLNIEQLQNQLGLYRYETLEEHILADIKRNSILKRLPIEIFELIMKEYVKKKVDGISIQVSPRELLCCGIALIDQYLNDGTDESISVLRIICDYLVVYDYECAPSQQFKILKSSVVTQEGIEEGLRWITKSMTS
eukprot:363444_1